jgi:hypothetical protein
MAINSEEAGGLSPHFCLSWLAHSCVSALSLAWSVLSTFLAPRVVCGPPSMALADETEVPPCEMEASPDAPSSSTDDSGGYESRSRGSDGEASESEESSQTKVAAAAAAVGITFDFGPSTVKKARIASLESCTHYFP